MAKVVIRDPEIMGGTPVFKGTRVPLKILFEYLEGGETLESFLEGSRLSHEIALYRRLKKPKNCYWLPLSAHSDR